MEESPSLTHEQLNTGKQPYTGHDERNTSKSDFTDYPFQSSEGEGQTSSWEDFRKEINMIHFFSGFFAEYKKNQKERKS